MSSESKWTEEDWKTLFTLVLACALTIFVSVVIFTLVRDRIADANTVSQCPRQYNDYPLVSFKVMDDGDEYDCRYGGKEASDDGA